MTIAISPSTLARALAASGLDLLAPPTCAACDARLTRRAVMCGACAPGVVRADRSEPEHVTAFAIYGGPIADALRKLKYGGRSDLAKPLAALARRVAREAKIDADVVIPVPLHPARLAERGYNQAALLGVEVAREIGAPFSARALVRVRPTPQQARLDREARLVNVAGAFHARQPERLRGKRALLVDDVCTTGATIAACRAALLEAGAIEVRAIVVARADLTAADVAARR